MLGQTIVLLALVATFAASAVAGIAGATRARTVEAARALVAPATESALAAYLRAVGATIAAQTAAAPRNALAPPPQIPALAGTEAFAAMRYAERADAGPYAVTVDVTPAAPARPVCAMGVAGTDTGPDLERNGQCSPFVQESRLALEVVAAVGIADAAGAVAPLAHGRATVTVRLFAQPPYAALVGIKDAVAMGAPHDADLGGYGNALGNFLGTLPDGDTTLHVVYACAPALGDCAASAPPPADRPTDVRWTDGN
jgi:hypothetical protein